MILTKNNSEITISTEVASNETQMITDIVNSFKTSLSPRNFKILNETPTDNELFARITLDSKINKICLCILNGNLNKKYELSNNTIINETYGLSEYSFTNFNQFSNSYLFYINNEDVIDDIVEKTVEFMWNTNLGSFPTPIKFFKVGDIITCRMNISESLQPFQNTSGVTQRGLKGSINMPSNFLPIHEDVMYVTDCNMVVLNSQVLTNVNVVQNTVLFIKKEGTSLMFEILPVPVPATGTAVAIGNNVYCALGGTWVTSAKYAKNLIFSYVIN